MKKHSDSKTDRREFLGSLATGAAAIGMATLATPMALAATPENPEQDTDLEAWFGKIKGKHKMVFDAPKPHEIFPFAWPRVFLMSNGMTGTPENECSVVVVLRHDAICYAFEDRVWPKYKFGEIFKANDPATKTASLRNPFAKPSPGEYKVPGFGPIPIGINELQASGVMFAVCKMAIGKTSAVLAQSAGVTAEEVQKDLMSALLPGVQPVPSGVWAIGRAQERGCGYCFAG
jgi:intracellular sulfur oxidation DsrE/DsrF family protein